MQYGECESRRKIQPGKARKSREHTALTAANEGITTGGLYCSSVSSRTANI